MENPREFAVGSEQTAPRLTAVTRRGNPSQTEHKLVAAPNTPSAKRRLPPDFVFWLLAFRGAREADSGKGEEGSSGGGEVAALDMGRESAVDCQPLQTLWPSGACSSSDYFR